MNRKYKEYWQNKENCANEALKYNGKYEFLKGSGGAADAAKRNGWYDEICLPMKKYN
jgi:hypothetical protein